MEKSTREYYFDNAKFLLMILVVFTHLLQPFVEDHPFYNELYYFIFTFHMPAFILISGYFTKNFDRPGNIKKLIKKLLLPYIVFQLVYSAYYSLIGLQEEFSWELLVPQWSLWFLLSLFFWQLSLYFFKLVPPEVGISISFVLSLISGYLPFISRNLTMQRTFAFLPFFVIGFYVTKDQMKQVQAGRYRWLALLSMALIFIFIHNIEYLNKYMVFGSKPYEEFLASPILGGAVRMLMLSLGLIGTYGILTIIPQKHFFFTKWGANTLLVYLLQGFIIKGLRALDIQELKLSMLGFAALILISLLLTMFLSSSRLAVLYQKFQLIINAVVDRLFAFRTSD